MNAYMNKTSGVVLEIEEQKAQKFVSCCIFWMGLWTSFSSHTAKQTEMRLLLINSILKMRNEYVRIDLHYNQEFT